MIPGNGRCPRPAVSANHTQFQRRAWTVKLAKAGRLAGQRGKAAGWGGTEGNECGRGLQRTCAESGAGNRRLDGKAMGINRDG